MLFEWWDVCCGVLDGCLIKDMCLVFLDVEGEVFGVVFVQVILDCYVDMDVVEKFEFFQFFNVEFEISLFELLDVIVVFQVSFDVLNYC